MYYMRLSILLSIFFVLGFFSAFAQNRTLTGKVVDTKSQPLPGVAIIQGGTNNGTTSNEDGTFSISVPAKDLVLDVSSLGYISKRINVSSTQNQVNITLEEDLLTLQETVVVGYGTQKKVNLTGSVSQVEMDDISANRPVTSIADALVGNVPGLTLTGKSGEPGSGYSYKIRGTSSINGSSPLILVDGIAMDVSALNPNDIESVSVLKDASASAVYGARAAFGVVLITTKKAKNEQAPQITFSTKLTFSGPQSYAKRATPLETVTAFKNSNLQTFSGGQNIDTWIDLLNNYESNPSNYPDGYTEVDGVRYQLKTTDVTKDLISTGFQQNYDLAAVGGSKKTRYRISASYLDTDGVLKTSKDSYYRYNITSFVSSDITKFLSTELSAFYTHTLKNDVNGLNFWNMSTRLASFIPTDGMMYNGKYYRFYTPKHILQSSGPKKIGYDRVNLLGRIILKPLQGFTVTTEYSINKTFYNYRIYNKKIEDMMDPETFQVQPADYKYSNLSLTKSNTDYDALNAFATYNKALGQHDFTLTAGINMEKRDNENLNASRSNMINDDLPALSLATNDPTVSDSYASSSIFGTFYRVNYSFKGRYLFEASGRYDGSSKFPKGHRFGFFPSFSAGWRISEEKFMKGLDFMSNLKIRGSWGRIGNQNISEYAFLPTMTSALAEWSINEVRPLTIGAPALVRTNFTWEKVETLNGGLDWGFFQDRLTGSFDIFRRKTLDMLGPGPDFPAVLGAISPLQNAADMKTDGWEFQIMWRDAIGQVGYRIGLNVSDARSEITKYNNPTKILSMTYYKGMKLGEIWGYESDRLYSTDDFVEGTLKTTSTGVLTGGTLKDGIPHFNGVRPNPGDMLYKNADEKGLIWTADNTVDNPGSRRIIGNSTPRYIFGISGDISYKGFNLSFLFTGVGKRDLWYYTNLSAPFGSNGWNFAVYKSTLDYWTPDNTNAKFPRLYEHNSGVNYSANSQVQTRFLRDASYIDLKSLVLSYNLPLTLLTKMKIKEMSVFVGGENLFSLNHMPKSIHPDAVIRTGGLIYPVMRELTIGINLTF